MYGILFDFNGTMFFDERFQNKAWKDFLYQELHHEVTEQELQEHIHGRNIEEILEYFYHEKFPHEYALEIEEKKESIYRNLCLESDDFHLAKGLSEFLDYLKDHNIPRTIATASSYNNVRFFFQYLELDNWFEFDKVMMNDGTFPGKPAPDIYLKAAEKIHVDIHDCIIFEDAKSGIEAARNAKAKIVFGITSMQDKNTLHAWGATDTIDDYSDLETLLKQIGI